MVAAGFEFLAPHKKVPPPVTVDTPCAAGAITVVEGNGALTHVVLCGCGVGRRSLQPVSFTHLTLPTRVSVSLLVVALPFTKE